MRKLLVFMLLLLMATGVAFAEGEGEEPAGEPDVTLMDLEEQDPEAAEPIDLSDVELRLAETSFEVTGSAIEPVPDLMYEGAKLDLTRDVDYALVYENNTKPGTATVTAVALEGEGAKCVNATQSASFEITAIALSKATMKLSQTQFYKTGSAIKPVPVLTYNGKTLTNGTDYILTYKNNTNAGTATVTASAADGSDYTGSRSATFTILPKKPAAAPIAKIKSSKPYVNVTWKKVTCTGYELQVSLKSDFSKVTKYKQKAVTKKVPKLTNGKKYYFRVRAYNTENGKTTYGAWSKSSAKVKTTGAVGNRYSRNGAYIKNKTIKLDGNYYYYNDAGLKSGCSKTMWDKVKNTKSKTKYLIAVDCSKNRTCVYEGKKGSWKLRSYWKCTTGKKSTPTIKGNFKVCGKVSHFGEANGYSVWHATRIKYEYYFHSVLYKPHSKSRYVDKRLGKNLSHGCIRLAIGNAKWIYKNCKKGTRIVIY